MRRHWKPWCYVSATESDLGSTLRRLAKRENSEALLIGLEGLDGAWAVDQGDYAHPHYRKKLTNSWRIQLCTARRRIEYT